MIEIAWATRPYGIKKPTEAVTQVSAHDAQSRRRRRRPQKSIEFVRITVTQSQCRAEEFAIANFLKAITIN